MAKLHVHMPFVAGWRASALRQHRCVGGPGARRRVRDGTISHCLQVDACCSVRNGCCVAIDLMAGDTRPDVYGPSHTAPFTVQAARVRLQQALAAMRWNSGNCRRPGGRQVAFTHK